MSVLPWKCLWPLLWCRDTGCNSYLSICYRSAQLPPALWFRRYLPSTPWWWIGSCQHSGSKTLLLTHQLAYYYIAIFYHPQGSSEQLTFTGVNPCWLKSPMTHHPSLVPRYVLFTWKWPRDCELGASHSKTHGSPDPLFPGVYNPTSVVRGYCVQLNAMRLSHSKSKLPIALRFVKMVADVS